MLRNLLRTSTAVVALCAMPAYAQTEAAGSAVAQSGETSDSPQPAEQDQSEPAAVAGGQSRPNAAATAGQSTLGDDIVVTGYRASLCTAQQIKRNSDAILDAIVAQDIGKLPDNTAAESLARVDRKSVV